MCAIKQSDHIPTWNQLTEFTSQALAYAKVIRMISHRHTVVSNYSTLQSLDVMCREINTLRNECHGWNILYVRYNLVKAYLQIGDDIKDRNTNKSFTNFDDKFISFNRTICTVQNLFWAYRLSYQIKGFRSEPRAFYIYHPLLYSITCFSFLHPNVLVEVI